MPSFFTFPQIAPILMLALSNVFMTFAWYGHLKYRSTPLLIAIVASWGIAFVEYCLAVPANRIFVVFSAFFLREQIGWNHVIGFGLIALGAAVKAPI